MGCLLPPLPSHRQPWAKHNIAIIRFVQLSFLDLVGWVVSGKLKSSTLAEQADFQTVPGAHEQHPILLHMRFSLKASQPCLPTAMRIWTRRNQTSTPARQRHDQGPGKGCVPSLHGGRPTAKFSIFTLKSPTLVLVPPTLTSTDFCSQRIIPLFIERRKRNKMSKDITLMARWIVNSHPRSPRLEQGTPHQVVLSLFLSFAPKHRRVIGNLTQHRCTVTCIPVTFSSSCRAVLVLRARMVTTPKSRAGFRLAPTSSKKTTWMQITWTLASLLPKQTHAWGIIPERNTFKCRQQWLFYNGEIKNEFSLHVTVFSPCNS